MIKIQTKLIFLKDYAKKMTKTPLRIKDVHQPAKIYCSFPPLFPAGCPRPMLRTRVSRPLPPPRQVSCLLAYRSTMMRCPHISRSAGVCHPMSYAPNLDSPLHLVLEVHHFTFLHLSAAPCTRYLLRSHCLCRSTTRLLTTLVNFLPPLVIYGATSVRIGHR